MEDRPILESVKQQPVTLPSLIGKAAMEGNRLHYPEHLRRRQLIESLNEITEFYQENGSEPVWIDFEASKYDYSGSIPKLLNKADLATDPEFRTQIRITKIEDTDLEKGYDTCFAIDLKVIQAEKSVQSLPDYVQHFAHIFTIDKQRLTSDADLVLKLIDTQHQSKRNHDKEIFTNDDKFTQITEAMVNIAQSLSSQTK